MGKIIVLGFVGSLRKDSYNKAILRAAVELAPEKMRIEVFDLEGIPTFNQDLESQPPKRVKEFKAKVRQRTRFWSLRQSTITRYQESSRTRLIGLRDHTVTTRSRTSR